MRLPHQWTRPVMLLWGGTDRGCVSGLSFALISVSALRESVRLMGRSNALCVLYSFLFFLNRDYKRQLLFA